MCVNSRLVSAPRPKNFMVTEIQRIKSGHGEIELFQKFQKIADGGPRRKTEKFWQIEKKIIDLYELDNSKKKIFFEKKFSK